MNENTNEMNENTNENTNEMKENSKVSKVNIQVLDIMYQLTGHLKAPVLSEAHQELFNFLEIRETWETDLEDYKAKVGDNIKKFKIVFDEKNQIIEGEKEKFEKVMKLVVSKEYEFVAPFFYQRFKELIPEGFNIDQIQFLKKYLVK